MSTEGQPWMSDWTAGVRLWLERGGEAILGPGRMELLEAIDQHRSISAGARALGMSYRRAWLLVESMNRAAGEVLVRTQTGGREGGGAELTGHGRMAVVAYRELQTRLQQDAASPLARPCPSIESTGVRIAAATSLEDVLGRLVADFAVHHPGLSVRSIWGASDELADQMLNGIHVDLFLSAEDRPLDRLAAAKLIVPRTRTFLAANRLSLISSDPAMANLRGPRALLRAGVRRIALAAPSCPLGKYSQAYLETAGLWDEVRRRVIFLDNPRVVLAAVATGQTNLGLVYRSDALHSQRCRVLFTTRPGQPAIRYTMALTQRGQQSSSAHAVFTYLTSADARSHLRRAGFLLTTESQSEGP